MRRLSSETRIFLPMKMCHFANDTKFRRVNLFGGDKRDRTAELLRDAAKAAFGGGKLNKNIQEGQRFGEQNKKDRSKSCLFSSGGDKRDRTADLLNAIQALSQLSYTPKCKSYFSRREGACQYFFIAEANLRCKRRERCSPTHQLRIAMPSSSSCRLREK